MNTKNQQKEKMLVNALTNNKSNRILYLVLFIPSIFVVGSLNSDIWFILNSGRYVLHNGIPHIEPFTIHEGMSFVMQQWLSAVIFWISYSFLGKFGLYIVVISVYALFIFVTLRLNMFLSKGNFFLSYVITLFSAVLLNGFMTERPFIFMILFVVLEIYYLELYIKSNEIKWLLPLIPISSLMSNLQAAMWPILFVVMLPYIIDSFRFKVGFIEGQGYGKKGLFFTMLLMFAAGFLNPYGTGAVTYLYKSYGFSEISNFVTEMLPASIGTQVGKWTLIIIFIVFFVICRYRKGKHRLRFYLLALGTAYLALSSMRSYPLFVICGMIPLSYYLKDYHANLEIKTDKKTLLIRKILVLMIVALSILNIYRLNNYIDKEHESMVKSADFLERFNKNEVKLYTGYDEGGYLEFRGFKVYIDPRAEVFLESNNKKSNIMKEYIEMKVGKRYYKEVLNKYNFTHLLVSNNDILSTYLPYDDGYNLIYSNDYYKIYESKSLNKK